MRKKGYSPRTAAPKEGQGNACAPGPASPTRTGEQTTAKAERYSPESLPPENPFVELQ